MIHFLNLLLRGVAVAAALLSPNRGSVFAQAAEISVDVQEAATAASVVYPWDDKHRALAPGSCLDGGACPLCFNDKSCCMKDNYNIYKETPNDQSLSCGSQSVKFISVDGFTVFDAESKKCNCGCTVCPACDNVTSPVNCQSEDKTKTFPLGTEIGACRGIDDVVTLQFELTIDVQVEYDIGLYINTVGGDAVTGTKCIIAGLTNQNATGQPYLNTGGATIIGLKDGIGGCYDFLASGRLTNYPFQQMELSCKDTDGDGLLDFHVAAAFAQNDAVTTCSYNSTLPNTLPHPGTTAKCWPGERVTLKIEVPPYNMPSSMPSTSANPSSNPTISAKPSRNPSGRPSLNPSGVPSGNPSSNPSDQPSTSQNPSSSPSDEPSISHNPSSNPSEHPSTSHNPSSNPSSRPSRNPSGIPSGNPSSNPSDQPSTSHNPSSSPSDQPTISHEPTISTAPSSNTDQPSSSPSISHDPTELPSFAPSISKEPSISPSSNPSSEPSAPPTGGLYYPDWENGEQICVNDGADPEFMKQIQRDNYIYRSKEECCLKHFWWRVAQCMQNEHPVWYSNGANCELTTNLEQWDVKYTPQTWAAADLFETLEQCCNAKFWWNVEGCKATSPKEVMFEFNFDVNALIVPLSCQDADTVGNALEVAMGSGFGVEVTSNVTTLGCVTLSRNVETSNTECGGCLAGSTYDGGFDGTRDKSYYTSYNVNQVTTIVVQVTSMCDASQCPDAASIETMYNQMVTNFKAYLESGQLQTKIQSWARERVPTVLELFEVQTVKDSFDTDGTYVNALADPEATVESISITTYGQLSVTGLDTTSFTSAQEEQVKTHFEVAIKSSLGSDLPPGSTVTVTSLENGIINYFITMVGFDPSEDASAAANTVVDSLADYSTLQAITTAVSSEPILSGITVLSNTQGASVESTVAKVTSAGQFSTSLTGLSTAEKAEVSNYFESAIAESLREGGELPEGAFVTATISDAGIVSYTITLYLDPGGDNAIIVSAINSKLTASSTWAAISNAVASEASAASPAITGASTFSISRFTQGVTKGVSFKPFYPDWLTPGNYCSNDGNSPPFMSQPDIRDGYIFTTKAECCAKWFSYAPDCVGGLGMASVVEKYYPDYVSRGCSKKSENLFKSWEQEKYDTLEQCCSEKFPYAKQTCCDLPGMGGCGGAGKTVFLPDWNANKCVRRDKGTLATYELEFAHDTQSSCCSAYFNWASASQRQSCFDT